MRNLATALVALGAAIPRAAGQEAAPAEPAKPAEVEEKSLFFSDEDGRFDVSAFLDEKYGFLPIVLPITEPAVGYGAAVGLAFISSPLGGAKEGLGRPNITMVAGMGTENGTWGVAAADIRYWLDDRLQTTVAVVDAGINLEFHGIGAGGFLESHPLDYEIHPVGGMVQTKYRMDDSHFWPGLSYTFAGTRVTFDDPTGTPGLPDFEHQTRVGGLTPSGTWDTRDNIFTPTRGSYVELGAGIYSRYLGGDDEFQRLQLTAMHFTPVATDLYLGVRALATATFGDAPFYMLPYLEMRGAPIMRYQGEEVAQIEAELRWQFWERVSLVGFVGGGAAWINAGAFDASQKIVTGGTGFRYELAREFGLHAGLDVAFSRDNAAVYLQIGGAWVRP